MIDAVRSDSAKIAFSARLSKGTKRLIRKGIQIEVDKETNATLRQQKFNIYTDIFESIKKELAATEIKGTNILDYDKKGIFLQFEEYSRRPKKTYLPDDLQQEMFVSLDGITNFPATKLDWLANFLKH